MKLKKLVGEEWANLLGTEGEELLYSIALKINTLRKKHTLIPKRGSDLIFKVFRDVPPNKVKVLIQGQEPYCQTSTIFDGYAFSCGNSLNPQPSLRNIIEEMQQNYPENLVLDRQDWTYLTLQGVFPVNSGLTAVLKKPGDVTNLILWKPFTEFWIQKLTEYKENVVVLVWGAKAYGFVPLFNKGKGWKCIITSHPSPLSNTKSMKGFPAFTGSRCFKQVNEFLITTKQAEIKW